MPDQPTLVLGPYYEVGNHPTIPEAWVVRACGTGEIILETLNVQDANTTAAKRNREERKRHGT